LKKKEKYFDLDLIVRELSKLDELMIICLLFLIEDPIKLDGIKLTGFFTPASRRESWANTSVLMQQSNIWCSLGSGFVQISMDYSTCLSLILLEESPG
jgi:hypothetical protein